MSSLRKTISRREPIISLTDFRYRGRNYKEGAYLDRRRTRMPNSKLVRLIREGVLVLAKDLSEEQLLKYGWIYNERIARLKLTKAVVNIAKQNQAEINKFFKEENEEDSPIELTLKHSGNGWYNVMNGDKKINEQALRKVDAQILIDNYGGDQNGGI